MSATITLYHGKDRGGDYKTLTESKPNLKDVNYHSSSGGETNNNMKRDASSLETSSGAYAVVYEREDYNTDYSPQLVEDGIDLVSAKILPNTYADNLNNLYCFHHDFYPHDLNNVIWSVELFDTQPNHFDLDHPTEHQTDNCWVKLFSESYYHRDNYNYQNTGSIVDTYDGIRNHGEVCNCIRGAGDINTTMLLRYACTLTKNNQADFSFLCNSLVTGSSTWLELYPETNCTGTPICIGPSSYIPDLGSTYNVFLFLSIRVSSSEPAGWEPTSQATISPSVRAENQHYQTATSLASLSVNILGLVPVPGFSQVSSVAGACLNIFWPTNPAIVDVFSDLTNYVTAILGDLVTEITANKLTTLLEGYQGYLENLYIYDKYDDLLYTNFTDLQSQISDDRPYFCGQGTEQTTEQKEHLTFQVAYMTIALLVDWIQAYHMDEVTTDPSKLPDAHNLATAQQQLTEDIADFQTIVANTIDYNVQQRMNQVTVKNLSGNSYYIFDAITGFRYYRSGISSDAAHNKLPTVQAMIGDNIRQKLQVYAQVADYFVYLDPSQNPSNNPDAAPLPPNPITTPNYYTVRVGYRNPNTNYVTSSVQLDNQQITHIRISNNGVGIGGVYFEFTEGTVDSYQFGSNDGANVSSNLQTDEVITAFYGLGEELYLTQLAFQTNQGRDLANGYSSGDCFYAVPPMGAQNKLVEITSGTTGGLITFLEFKYELVVPTLTETGYNYPPYNNLKNA